MVLAWVWECTPVTSALGLGEEDQELRAASPKAAPSSCCSQQALHQNSNASQDRLAWGSGTHGV